MFCGALTGRIKPKLTTYCRIIVIPMTLTPGVLSCCKTEMIIGIIAEARPAALAKPMCTMMRKSAIVASTMSVVELARLKVVTMTLASQVAAFVERSAPPREMPTPKSTTVPQLILLTTSCHCITPIFGSIKSVMAIMVVVEVSRTCSFFSVVQRNNRQMEMTSSLISFVVILPISARSFLMVSLPPGISLISGGMRNIMTW